MNGTSYTKIGNKYVVHGIFGEGATDIIEEKAGELTKADIKSIKADGQEMLRIFNTPAEAEAYIQGLTDMDGWMAWQTTSLADHEKIYGDIKKAIKKLK
jgi:hypothetical protein